MTHQNSYGRYSLADLCYQASGGDPILALWLAILLTTGKLEHPTKAAA